MSCNSLIGMSVEGTLNVKEVPEGQLSNAALVLILGLLDGLVAGSTLLIKAHVEQVEKDAFGAPPDDPSQN